ncbi:hypothetical protein AaE_010110 [Aphanomyces astaci]|uniref:OBG-type G domain-containing protein n=1 Tax=Aphanomyces astaci TaxID=112090 RepID=A0A6A5A640_APHAT|nr:hypothetical protein AaE_010110 [Aphanomyces astaci]
MKRTQKNKATEGHLGHLKAKLAKLRTELLDGEKSSGGGGEGFDVARSGDGRVALIGFPSVGKSTLLSQLTDTVSETNAVEFTTLTCIPGNLMYNDVRIQLLDLPGIIEGASHGKGRGREVIAVSKSADMILMVLDAGREEGNRHRTILENELETVGLRLNRNPPDIYFRKKAGGGVQFNATVRLTKLGDDPAKTVYKILHEYRMHNCELLFREDCTVDDLIDVLEGNRKYIKCLYVYNKIDVVSIEDVDRLARLPHSVVIACEHKGRPAISKDMLDNFNFALVWGTSTKYNPQRVGKEHVLQDEDVLQVVTLTVTQQKHAKNYNQKVQAHWDKYKAKKKALKT